MDSCVRTELVQCSGPTHHGFRTFFICADGLTHGRLGYGAYIGYNLLDMISEGSPTHNIRIMVP